MASHNHHHQHYSTSQDTLDFDRELHALFESKLPISASRIQAITKQALKQAPVGSFLIFLFSIFFFSIFYFLFSFLFEKTLPYI